MLIVFSIEIIKLYTLRHKWHIGIMAQSLNKIFIHLIFHIKTTSPTIREEDLERLHAYIGQLINTTGCKSVHVGGVNDHVHLLFLLSREASIAYVVEEIKRNSSRWIKSLSKYYEGFTWQNGYAAFSVSKSVVKKTLKYILEQKEHHKKTTFAEEYKAFLDSYGVDYDKRYFLRD